MATLAIGTTNVPSAGTAVQIDSTAGDVAWMMIKPHEGNNGDVYFGLSDVSSTVGLSLSKTDVGKALPFASEGGSISRTVLYVDAASNNDKVDWVMLLR
ncbi:hypothetical protein CMI37_28880 [Candidatus Pacearchaeota archaeon]|jgi:hypothetical protein|nr:hypothetical protein [Candidatus Pacearchaeota archaeon]